MFGKEVKTLPVRNNSVFLTQEREFFIHIMFVVGLRS